MVDKHWPTGRIPEPQSTGVVPATLALLGCVAFLTVCLYIGIPREAHREAVAHKIECQQYHHKGCK